MSRVAAALGAVAASMWLITSAAEGAGRRGVTPEVASVSDIPSHNRLYRASLIPSPDPIERNRPLTWTLEVRTAAGGPVDGAALALESWMPDDESVTAPRPRLSAELGGGRYTVERLRFDRSGWWNVKLQISAAAGTDSLAFNLVLPE